MIPKRPTTAPAAHIHLGTCATRSSTFHTCSGTASAESIVDYWSIGQLKSRFWERMHDKSAIYELAGTYTLVELINDKLEGNCQT